MTTLATRTAGSGAAPEPGIRRPIPRIESAVLAAVVVAGVVLRFVTMSPLWLDEALSVDIASLPVPDLLDALRHDGHPPLYYLVLHAWLEIFGDGDAAARALSGVFGVAVLPLAWTLGRRRGGPRAGAAALVLTAVAPYMVRYATEARMYAMLSVLMVGAWLVADDLRAVDGRSCGWVRRRWVGLAALTGAALLTHYWMLYAGASAVGMLAFRWWRHGARDEAVRVGSALAAGALAFVPWIPSFLYQAAHTGTPWGTATRPTRALTDLLSDLGGRSGLSEALLFGVGVAVLTGIALLVVDARPWQLQLDLRTAPRVRREVFMAGATLAVGLAAGAVTSATFMGRYAAGILALVLVAAGVGVNVLTTRGGRIAALVMLGLAAPGLAFGVVDDRSQGRALAERIEADGTVDDLVAFCPDQLGPATLRYLPEDVDAVGVPALDRPTRIDWVDYAERNTSADASDVADRLVARAGDHTIWVVHEGSYRTYEDLCEDLLVELSQRRPSSGLVQPEDSEIPERATLFRFDP